VKQPGGPSSRSLCGQGRLDTFAALPLAGEQRFTYLRCRRCGLARLADGQADDNLQAFYAAEYEPVCTDFATGHRSLLSYLRETNFHLMARRIEATIPTGRILDVGCGSGVFLAAMSRRGWDVAGIEPHRAVVEDLRRHHGFDVREGMLDDTPVDWGPFDVVALLDVLEHLPYPSAALERVWLLLRPGGLLVIATPNVESLEHRIFGQSWFALQPPDHLWLFSPHSLKRTVTLAGFVQLSMAASPISYAWPSLRRLLRIGEPSRTVDAALKALAALPMGALGLLRSAPANLELYARRPA